MSERVFFGDVASHRAKANRLFGDIAQRLRTLVPFAHIEHVGSTALPDGLTKGDLDVQVRVRLEDYDRACHVLASELEPNPGGFVEQGKSFKDDTSDPPLGVHVTVIGGPSDIQHRQRDYLARRPHLRAEYDAVKRTFEGGDMSAYREAKDAFFTRVGKAMCDVRRVRLADAANLRDVRLRALETDPLSFGSSYAREAAWEPSEWERWAIEHASGNDKATFLAFREDVVVGIAGAFRQTANPTSPHVFSMWVAPDVRRFGIAQRLVHAVVAWATELGATSLNLWVTQPGARAFYASCGFADDGRRQPLPSAPGVVEHGMTRKL
jgi:GrpB-like predicted nucleotidyltransferase (UPF0157 family)/ribosomal protein S18 acetylase RimI-like enzyme